jgi:hypothetical protein
MSGTIAQENDDLTTATPMETVQSPTSYLAQERASLKHRLSESEDVQQPAKRQRTDHDREEDVKMEDAPSTTTVPTAPPFSFPVKTFEPTSPRIGDDLMSLYGMVEFADRFKRITDPVTGKNPNKLRKTFAPHITDLAGRNKPLDKPQELYALLNYPDEEYHIQKVMGKELVKRDHLGNEVHGHDPLNNILAKLGDAVKMTPGKLPDGEWTAFFNDETKKAAPTVKTDKGPAAVVRASQQHSVSAPSSPLPSHRHAGPRVQLRQNTKRRYDDDAFEGYGDGYEDGEMSVDDDETRSTASGTLRKKRRKESTTVRYGNQVLMNYAPKDILTEILQPRSYVAGILMVAYALDNMLRHSLEILAHACLWQQSEQPSPSEWDQCIRVAGCLRQPLNPLGWNSINWDAGTIASEINNTTTAHASNSNRPQGSQRALD